MPVWMVTVKHVIGVDYRIGILSNVTCKIITSTYCYIAVGFVAHLLHQNITGPCGLESTTLVGRREGSAYFSRKCGAVLKLLLWTRNYVSLYWVSRNFKPSANFAREAVGTYRGTKFLVTDVTYKWISKSLFSVLMDWSRWIDSLTSSFTGLETRRLLRRNIKDTLF
jgi:hypothetical protein